MKISAIIECVRVIMNPICMVELGRAIWLIMRDTNLVAQGLGYGSPAISFLFFPVTLDPFVASRAMDCISADLRAFLQGIGLQDGLELTEYYNTADSFAAAVPVLLKHVVGRCLDSGAVASTPPY